MDYLVTPGTYGRNVGEDNICGLTQMHSYSLFSSFFLRDEDENIVERMHMVRNPHGEDRFYL